VKFTEVRKSDILLNIWEERWWFNWRKLKFYRAVIYGAAGPNPSGLKRSRFGDDGKQNGLNKQ
jgi:hypothetical protein